MNCTLIVSLGQIYMRAKARRKIRTYDSLAQQRALASQSLTTYVKVAELLGQHGLEVLGAKGEHVLPQTSPRPLLRRKFET